MVSGAEVFSKFLELNFHLIVCQVWPEWPYMGLCQSHGIFLGPPTWEDPPSTGICCSEKSKSEQKTWHSCLTRRLWFSGSSLHIIVTFIKQTSGRRPATFEYYTPERLRPINIIKVCIKFIPRAVVTNDTNRSKRYWTPLREVNETWMKVNNCLTRC